ncbi:MAG: KpsF/GutQ family sugar-phosphate isomerase [Pseudomonadota bacterium]|nr:KpsF/GutQ family sugar-phosphate isomerase [Pseudomonadota bacterium]QKK06608.1 MAG: KpsF/GutQ family sugar-phosphate isomerase [Pseudomonadota bacterium]
MAAVSASNRSAARVLAMEADALQNLADKIWSDEEFSRAVDLIAAIEGRVIVTGMGKSGHIARKIAATMASTGTPAFFVHPGEASHGDMGMIVRGDVVLALSNSGESREMNDLIEYTRRFAIPLIGVTSRPGSTLGESADIVLELPALPEACPNGLAPTTSTTMSLAIGDALAIALLESKGFTATDFQVYHPGGKLGQQLMRASEIMHKGDAVPLISLDAPLKETFTVMTEKGFGAIGLVDADGLLAGIITDGDIRRHISDDILNKTAGDIMTATPKIIRPETLVGEAMGIMNDVTQSFRRITCLFVVQEDGKPVGILHLHDCLRAGFS